MSLPRTLTALAIAVSGFLMSSAAPAAAQDVQYETVTKLEWGGATDPAMRLAMRLAGVSSETVETTYIKGRRMRTDADKTSLIVDMETGRVFHIDHDKRTYSVMEFGEMLDRARQAGEELSAAPDAHLITEGDDTHHLSFRVAVEAANERQRIAGYDAERFFMTMEVEGEFTPEAGGQREQAGTVALLTDMWASTDVPALRALEAFQDVDARQYADFGSALMEGMAAAFAEDPRMTVAFQQSVDEARGIEGMPLRTVVSFVTVAPGEKFDRELVTGPAATGSSGNVAQQAGRAALGRLGRVGRQQPAQPQADELTQATLMTVTTEIRNISVRDLDAQLFEVPQEYRKVQ